MVREPFNTYSHATGAVLAVVGTVVLALLSGSSAVKLAGALVFGVSMVLLYTSSAVYHAVRVSEKTLLALRKLDHAAIFLFIAGSYTPVLLNTLETSWRPWALVLVWTLAVLGVVQKLISMNLPRWLTTTSYLGLGWLAVFLMPKMQLDAWALGWLIAGGLAYSLGAITYATKRPNWFPQVVGFHGLWHLWVIAGSGFVYLAVLRIYTA